MHNPHILYLLTAKENIKRMKDGYKIWSLISGRDRKVEKENDKSTTDTKKEDRKGKDTVKDRVGKSESERERERERK